MVERFFKGAALRRLTVNPLGCHLDSFSTVVAQRGYARATIRSQLWLLADLGRWLRRKGLSVRDVRSSVIDAFLRRRRRASGLRRGDEATLRRFVEHLQTEGVIAALRPVIDRTALGRLHGRYDEYLRKQRGLSPSTVYRNGFVVRRFLSQRFGDGPIRLRQLRPEDVTHFLLRHPSRCTPTVSLYGSALRSFFRFLFQQGATTRDLSVAVPMVRRWRLVDVPKYLEPADVEHVVRPHRVGRPPQLRRPALAGAPRPSGRRGRPHGTGRP